MSLKKVIVLLAGPPRYCDLVAHQLNCRFSAFELKIFVFLWWGDAHGKVRQGHVCTPDQVARIPNVVAVHTEPPLDCSDFKTRIGSYINTHSSVEAVIGMYYSMSRLIEIVGEEMDRADFVLRCRTDVWFHPTFGIDSVSLRKDVIYECYDLELPSDWVNDQLMLADPQVFRRIWSFASRTEIENLFLSEARNPERMLTRRVRDCVARGMAARQRWLRRYRDYELVYNPPRDKDYNWMKLALEGIGVSGLYSGTAGIVNDDEVAQNNRRLESIGYLPDCYRNETVNRVRFLLVQAGLYERSSKLYRFLRGRLNGSRPA